MIHIGMLLQESCMLSGLFTLISFVVVVGDVVVIDCSTGVCRATDCYTLQGYILLHNVGLQIATYCRATYCYILQGYRVLHIVWLHIATYFRATDCYILQGYILLHIEGLQMATYRRATNKPLHILTLKSDIASEIYSVAELPQPVFF